MSDGRYYKQHRYDQILEEQVSISYAANGISISDTDDLSPYDREMILKTIYKIKEMEREAQERAQGMITSRKTSRF